MNFIKGFMLLAVWAALTTTSMSHADLVIGGGDDMGSIGEGDFGGDIDEGDVDVEEIPGTGSIYDSVESPPMTGGGNIDLLGIHDRRPIACFARNGRGDVFDALGARPMLVQERAMRKCEAVSRRCRPLGCHRLM